MHDNGEEIARWAKPSKLDEAIDTIGLAVLLAGAAGALWTVAAIVKGDLATNAALVAAALAATAVMMGAWAVLRDAGHDRPRRQAANVLGGGRLRPRWHVPVYVAIITLMVAVIVVLFQMIGRT